MGKCGTVCAAIVVAAVAAVVVPLATHYQALAPDQPFALMTSHNATANPPNRVSRYRGREYHRPDRFFFQWWNYLVFDADTRDHFNLIYQISEFSEKFEAGRNMSEAFTSMAHFQGAEYRASGGDGVPLADASLEGEWGLHLHRDGGKGRTGGQPHTTYALRPSQAGRDGRPAAATTPLEARLAGIPHQQNLIDDDTYQVLATVPADRSLTGVEIEWNLTFRRIHGVYTNADAEDGARGDLCLMLSTLWGYNSEVWGTIREGDKVYTITRSPRYRAYAAGSWGCTLPGGSPAIRYPWVWFWLVVPGATPAQDLSFAWGSATLQTPTVGDIKGWFAATGIDGQVVSARKSRMFAHSAAEFTLQASASDGYVAAMDTTQSEWVEYRDALGTALIPLQQTYRLQTASYNFSLAFRSSVDQYFRCPVWIESTGADGTLKLFSDFRAVGTTVHIVIHKRDAATGAWALHTDLTTTSTNALEYAYEADLDASAGVTPLTAWKNRFQRHSATTPAPAPAPAADTA